MIYQILLCLHPHIYKSIKTTPDLHQSKILYLVCCNQYNIVPHRTNSSFALFLYITTHINNPLNCKSSCTISDLCTVCWLQFLLTCSDFSSCSEISFYDQITSKPKYEPITIFCIYYNSTKYRLPLYPQYNLHRTTLYDISS